MSWSALTTIWALLVCTDSDFPLTIMELDGPLMLAWCLHGDVGLSLWCGAGREKRWHGTEVKMWVLYTQVF